MVVRRVVLTRYRRGVGALRVGAVAVRARRVRRGTRRPLHQFLSAPPARPRLLVLHRQQRHRHRIGKFLPVLSARKLSGASLPLYPAVCDRITTLTLTLILA